MVSTDVVVFVCSDRKAETAGGLPNGRGVSIALRAKQAVMGSANFLLFLLPRVVTRPRRVPQPCHQLFATSSSK